MKRFITIGCGVASLLAMSLASSCNSKDDPEILKPVSEHILGKWNISDGYIFNDGKWEKHDDPASPRITYDFKASNSLLMCSTDGEGWSSYSTLPYEVDESKMTVTTGSAESKIELLSADSLVMVSDFIHNPTTGELLPEPLHYKWGFSRSDSAGQSLGEMLVDKWEFLGTEEKKDGVWTDSTDVMTPDESTMEFTADGLYILDMVIFGEEYETKYSWKINNASGSVQMKLVDGDHIIDGRVEFVGNDKMWIYYTGTSDGGAVRELRDECSRIVQ